MKPERFIYLDNMGIANLYADMRGQDVVETAYSMEESQKSGLNLSISAFLGLGGMGESNKKEVKTFKTTLRAENMLREIIANFHACGTIHKSMQAAIEANKKLNEPQWIEARYSFSVPLKFNEFNKNRAVTFVSGMAPYFDPSPQNPPISMSASLYKFPCARDGQLSSSGHDGLLFKKLNGQPYSYLVFGALNSCAEEFQIKPYAIRL